MAEHLSVADKESQYRRLDRNFSILHSYDVDDCVAEEAKVLARLRVVAGTEYRGAGREVFNLSVDTAIAVAAAKSPYELQETARNIILSHRAGPTGESVKDLLAELNQMADNTSMSLAGRLARLNAIRSAMMAIGLLPVMAGPEQDLAVSTFGGVSDPSRLLKAIPGLKAYATALENLTF